MQFRFRMLFLLFKITTSFKTTWTIVIKADSNIIHYNTMTSTSSTIAILSGASLAVSGAAAGVSKTEAQDVNNNNGALPHHHKPQIILQSTTLGKECNTLTLDSTVNNVKWVAKSEEKEDDTDIGLLIVDCNNDNENCLPDDTSSLGGRCTTRKDITNSPPAYKASTNITTKRQLRSDPDVEWIKDALEGKVSIFCCLFVTVYYVCYDLQMYYII